MTTVINESGSSVSVRRIRVMLADDHKVVRQGIATLLGCEPDIEVVGLVSDGQSAVDTVPRVKPQVILMDMSMPVLDGIEATRIIHRDFPEIAIIGLSMFEGDEQADAMRSAGATGFLTKGGPAEDLLAAIRNCAST